MCSRKKLVLGLKSAIYVTLRIAFRLSNHIQVQVEVEGAVDRCIQLLILAKILVAAQMKNTLITKSLLLLH